MVNKFDGNEAAANIAIDVLKEYAEAMKKHVKGKISSFEESALIFASTAIIVESILFSNFDNQKFPKDMEVNLLNSFIENLKKVYKDYSNDIKKTKSDFPQGDTQEKLSEILAALNSGKKITLFKTEGGVQFILNEVH